MSRIGLVGGTIVSEGGFQLVELPVLMGQVQAGLDVSGRDVDLTAQPGDLGRVLGEGLEARQGMFGVGDAAKGREG